ncbi:hypothetical protein MKS88_003448 [Plasmodium brasilianum]|uniref:Uncharacterized protein n=1 Tax=Plasmodium brasilianum TaxID=5824 RepID=A0ACB9Y9C6_PLABR|nr:hypothetical protein MKS88_003448 [Plasmodium brasilianum]
MEEKCKLHFYIKICTLFLLTWTCYFYNNMRIYNECLNEKNYNDIKLVTRTYRLLAKHKQGRRSNIVSIKVKKPNNREYEKEGMYNNEKVYKGKNKPLNERSLNIAVEYGQSRKNRSYLCNRENSCSGKRILDSMYYKN